MKNLTRILCLGTLAFALVAVGPAAAQVQPAGTGEPLFTNSAQNTQWFEWPASSGIGAYRIRYDFRENDVLKASPTYNQTNGGTGWANWSGVANLQHGGQYSMCAQGQYTFPNDSLWISDGSDSCYMGTVLGRRAYTTIDRSKPSAAITLASGAQYSKTSAIPLSIAFSDDVAGPFPANFLCFQDGGGPTDVCSAVSGAMYGYVAGCSSPAGGGKSTTFACTADASTRADGVLWACVRAADASIPDNPYGSNQSSTAEKANLSDAACDDIVLDRTAPNVTLTVPKTAKVGTSLKFVSNSADATSGIKKRDWTWGDGTANASTAVAYHTFTAPGTYAVKFKATDKAGNGKTVVRSVTVTAAAAATRYATTTAGPALRTSQVHHVTPFATGKAGPAKVGRGPRALPDGRFHGPRPEATVIAR